MRLAFAYVVVAASCTSEHVYSLDDLPIEEWTAGLPVRGDGRMLVWLARSPGDWSDAVGFVRFRCDDCTLGDDRAGMKIESLGNVDFGHITFGNVRAALDFADHRVTMTTTWRSPDFELDAKVVGLLAPRADDIVLDGCISFRPTPALLERDPKTHAVATLTGAPIGPDDRYSIKVGGTLKKMKLLGEVCSVHFTRKQLQ